MAVGQILRDASGRLKRDTDGRLLLWTQEGAQAPMPADRWWDVEVLLNFFQQDSASQFFELNIYTFGLMFPINSVGQSGVLEIYCNNINYFPAGQGPKVSIYEVTEPWLVYDVDWFTRPSIGAKIIDEQVPIEGDWNSFILSASQYGYWFEITSDYSGTTTVYFDSSDRNILISDTRPIWTPD